MFFSTMFYCTIFSQPRVKSESSNAPSIPLIGLVILTLCWKTDHQTDGMCFYIEYLLFED